MNTRTITSWLSCLCSLALALLIYSTAKMSYMLAHLHNGWQVDQAILSEEERVVVLRFGHDWDPTCMQMDEMLYKVADSVSHELM